jgi:nicotinamide mononucleotide transporter
MALAGIIVWKKNLTKTRVRMRGLKAKEITILAALIVICIAFGGWLLSLLEGQNNPYLDAATNVLSVAATFLMTWRFKEQWLCYIILDVLTVILWIFRAFGGSPEGLLMVLMWTAFLINAIYGYYVWTIGARADIEQKL